VVRGSVQPETPLCPKTSSGHYPRVTLQEAVSQPALQYSIDDVMLHLSFLLFPLDSFFTTFIGYILPLRQLRGD
jgi:hypothetical protein